MAARSVTDILRVPASDLSQNVTLSRSVGWQDVESEWRVLHAAADVQGVYEDGRLVAQGALADYGVGASLAKMVVAGHYQRRGLGGRLLEHFLAKADARGIPVGLCATEQGRPLYRSRGFEVTGELVVLFGLADPTKLEAARHDTVTPLLEVERAVEQDGQLSSCDRSAMLRARFAESAARFAIREGRGFGLATWQGEHALVGPILAENEQDARALCGALLGAVARPARLDVPLEHVELRRWLVQLGLREMSQRVEMARSVTRLPWQSPTRYALAGQAWG